MAPGQDSLSAPAPSRQPLVLAGDIGGTKTWLGIFRAESPAPTATLVLQRAEKFSSPSAGSLQDLVARFLGPQPEPVDHASFGLPGPVSGSHAKLVNLPWEVDASVLAGHFGLRTCSLINDLEANAWGIGELDPADFCVLQGGAPRASGNMAVISPGTGLGEAGLYFDGHRHHPFACEGGHCDFAPHTETELALLDYLFRLHGHVSCERVLSGSMGIPNIYQFLRDSGRAQETPAIARQIAEGDTGAVISRAAAEGSCPLCRQTMQIFAGTLGAEAGNLALKTMATGGVFIGGGIATKNLPLLQEPLVIEAFRAKGRFRPFMENIPLRVILNERAALLGAARHALLSASPDGSGH